MDNNVAHFLQGIFRDALSLNFVYLLPPYTDLSSVDIHLRHGLQSTETLYNAFFERFQSVEYGYFYVLRDRFFLNYIVVRLYENRGGIVSIGPYLETKVDDELINRIASLNGLDYSSAETIRAYLQQFPTFSNKLKLISTLMDVLQFVNPPTVNFEERNICLYDDTQESALYRPSDDFQTYVKTVETRYAIEEELISNVAEGNLTKALATSRRFMALPLEQALPDSLTDHKILLYSVNNLLRKAAQRGEVHPIYLHELSTKYRKRIDNLNSMQEVQRCHEAMLHDYCQLVKEKSRIRFSPLVRNALNIIDLNVSEPITLSILSEQMNVNASYLSKVFSAEVGMPITEYVNTRKVQTAAKMLDTTSMQIQEVASYVGINDLNYFSKMFKKYTGSTPSKYRKVKS